MAPKSRPAVALASGIALALLLTLSGVEAALGAAPKFSPCLPYSQANECDFLLTIPNFGFPPYFVIPDPTKETVFPAPIITSKPVVRPVVSATSNDECLPGAGVSTDCKKQFYVSGNQVVARRVQDADSGFFCNKCYKLKLTNVQLADGGPLNPNDNNKQYPEARRCVTFSVVC